MANLDNPLATQFYPLWKPVTKTDTTFQIQGRFVKDSEAVGTKYLAGKQMFTFNARGKRAEQERFYMDVSVDPTLVSGTTDVYEYTLSTINHRGVESDNTVAPPTKYDSSKRLRHESGTFVGITISPEWQAELNDSFTSASTTFTATYGETLTEKDPIMINSVTSKIEKYDGTYPFAGIVITSGVLDDVNIVGAVNYKYANYGVLTSANVYVETDGTFVQTATTTTIKVGVSQLNETTQTLVDIQFALAGDAIDEASQAEAEAGTAQGVYNSPLRTQQQHTANLDTVETLTGKTLKDATITTTAEDTNGIVFDNSALSAERTVTMPDTAVDLGLISTALQGLEFVSVSASDTQTTNAAYNNVIAHSLGKTPVLAVIQTYSSSDTEIGVLPATTITDGTTTWGPTELGRNTSPTPDATFALESPAITFDSSSQVTLKTRKAGEASSSATYTTQILLFA